MRGRGTEGWDRALRRMLAGGALTGWPRRPSDQEILIALAAARFEPGSELAEREVNDRLREWLATFSAPFGIDHVTLRRALVDRGFLVRDRAGSTYRADPERIGETGAAAPGTPDPASILRELRQERHSRKDRRLAAIPKEEAMPPKTPPHSHEHAHDHEHTHEHVHRHGDLVHSHPHTHKHSHEHGHSHSHEGEHGHGDAAHAHAHIPEAHDHGHDEMTGEVHERSPHDHEHP